MIPPVGPALPAYPESVSVAGDSRPVTTVGLRAQGTAVTANFGSLPPRGSTQNKSVTILGTEPDQINLPPVLVKKPTIASMQGSRRGSLNGTAQVEEATEMEPEAKKPLIRQATKFPYMEMKRPETMPVARQPSFGKKQEGAIPTGNKLKRTGDNFFN